MLESPDVAWRRLQRSELPAGSRAQARFLLGKLLVRRLAAGTCVGRIVETEAYLPGDPASHAYRGRTPRNASMFLAAGHAYVYLSYGNHWMLNVSSEADGVGCGVLLRAAWPIAGLDLMRVARGDVAERDLARGPGRLAAAFAVDRSLDGIDLTAADALYLATDGAARGPVASSVRIGISKATERPWRYFLRDHPGVSGPRWLNGESPRRTARLRRPSRE